MRIAPFLLLAFLVSCSGSKSTETSQSPAQAPSFETPSEVSTNPLEGDDFLSVNGQKLELSESPKGELVNGQLNFSIPLPDNKLFQVNGIEGLTEQYSEASKFQLVLLNFQSAPHQAFSGQVQNKLWGTLGTNQSGTSSVSVKIQGTLIKGEDDSLVVEGLFKDIKIEESEIIPE